MIGTSLLFAAVAPTARAASASWTGITNGLWSAANGPNWSTGAGNAPGTTTGTTNTDTATFNGAGNGNTTITVDPNRNIENITFNTSTVSYTIGSSGGNAGNALLLTSGGTILLTSSATGTGLVETFNAPLTLEGNYSFTDNRGDAASNFVFAGNISNAGTSTLTLGGTGTGTNVISGSISNGTGVQGVTVSNGLWSLQGANSYTGATLVSAGTLSVSGAGTLGSTTSSLTLSGGTLDLGTTSQTVGAVSITAAASSGNTIQNGTLTGTSYAATNTSGTATITAVLSGTAALTKSGAGTLALAGANTYDGGTTLNAGTLDITGAGTLGATTCALTLSGGTLDLGTTSQTVGAVNITAAASSGNTIQNGTLTGTAYAVTNTSGTVTITAVLGGTAALTKSGAGTLTLAAANTYSGATTINQGTLSLDFTQATSPATNIVSNSSTLVLGGGALTITGSASTTNSETFGATTVNAGYSTITPTSGAGGTLNIGLGAITRNIGGVVNMTLPANGTITTVTANTVGTILGGWAIVGGTTWAVSAGNGTTAGSITPLLTYLTTTTAGTTAASYSGANIDVTSSPTLLAAITPNSLRFNTTAGETLTLSGSSVVNSGGILVTSTVGNNTSTITGGSSLTSGTTDLIVSNFDTSQKLIIATPITDNGTTSIGLTVAGPGQVYVTGSNTYTGVTTIAGSGQLVLGSNGTTGSIASTQPILDNGTLAFYRTNANSLSNNISGTGLISNAASGTATLSGNLSGGLGLLVSSGVLVLSGSNTNTGTIQVNDNTTLRLVADSGNTTSGTSNVFGSGSLTAGSTGNPAPIFQLRADSSVAFSIPNIIGGTGTPNFTFDVNNVAALPSSGPQGNTLTITGTYSPGSSGNDHATTTNVTGGNGYILGLGTVLAEGATTNVNTYNVAAGLGLNIATLYQLNNGKGHAILSFTGAGTTTIGTLSSIAGTRFDMNISAGTLNLTGSDNLSQSGGPTITMTGGTLDLGNANALNTSSGTVTTLAQSGGGSIDNTGTGSSTYTTLAQNITQTWNNGFTFVGTNALNMGTGTITMNGTTTVTVDASTLTLGGPLVSSSGAGLTKAGAGTLALSGSSTYSGATTITAGTLIVSGSLSGSGAVTVGNSASLGTSAILAVTGKVGNVTLGAAASNTGAELETSALAESVGAGVLGTVNNLTITSGNLALNVGRSSPGATLAGDGSDQISAAGSVSLGSSGNLLLTAQSGYTPTVGDFLYLLLGGSAPTGSFATVNGSAITSNDFTFDGYNWQIGYNATSAGVFGGGDDVAIEALSLTAVPEPSTWASLFAGVGMLVLLQRNRRRKI